MKAIVAGGAMGIGPGAVGGPESQRETPMAAEQIKTQVCVIGGGSGGIGAAVAAARSGAEVVLLEREAALGGTSTMAWVHTWEPVSGADGLARELYGMMKADPLAVVEADYAKGAPRVGGTPLPFEPRSLMLAARRALDATKRCRVLLGTTVCGVRVTGSRIAAVEAYFHAKRLVVEADVFIDCTADGDVCAAAGCEYHLGEDPKGRYNEPSAPAKAETRLNSCTLVYRISDCGVRHKPYLPKGIRRGLCPRPTCIRRMPNGDLLLNAVNMVEGNPLDPDDRSRMLREAHRKVFEHFHWLQAEITSPAKMPGYMRALVPTKGFATWSIAGIAPRLGVRETRRIVGEYVLTEHDVQAGRTKQTHDDIIAITDHAVDIHGSRHRLYEVPNGPYGIPYRCLLPKGADNLLIASRAAGFSHVAASSCRLSRQMMALGQAAGTAAAMAGKARVSPARIDVEALQGALKKQGVAIGV